MNETRFGNRKIVITALGVTVVVVAAALAVAAAQGAFGDDHVMTVDYASGAEGKANQDARLPSWVPDQAKSVTEVIRTTGSERILRFTVAGAELPASCVPGAAGRTTATLTADWWPHGQEGKADQICATDWHVFADGDTVYAFRPETTDQSRER